MIKHKYLKECRDWEILKDNLSEKTLDYFEEELSYYLNSDAELDEDYSAPDIVRWWEGLCDTKEIIEDWKDN